MRKHGCRGRSLLVPALLALALAAPAAAQLTVTVDPNGARTAMNPLIFGVAHFDEAGSSQLAYPARRWGGNATTRYNWEIDIQNRASDWFFLNEPNYPPDTSHFPNNSTADLWVDSVKAHGGEPVLTVPTIGWAPKGSDPATDRKVTWGYSVANYGSQAQTECTASGWASWCHPDAGNGCQPATACTWLAAPDPTDTSKAVTPAYETSWMAHIASRVGWSNAGGVRYLILDNEPMLWNSTHHDVHPDPVTYDELWAKSRDTAAALKAQDPSAQVLGGAAWGWCEYFNSSKDSGLYGACGPNAVTDPASDYATHGNLHWYPYLLQQAEAYRVAHGARLLDFIDVHFYPQAQNVTLTTDESSATSALRLRTLRSLYDPTYVDESWIGQPVNLIPRMKAWIDAYAPGTKLAINEYNFGDASMGATSALAQAEALAIFAREGVDMANRWVVPPANSLIEDAFLLYLNYDGAGGKVAGDVVPTASSNPNVIGAYTVRGTSSLYFLLFNHDTSDHAVTLSVTGGLDATASLTRFSGSMRLGSAGTAPVAGGTLALTLPSRSATLAVVPYPQALALKFFPLAPCRLVDTRDQAGPVGAPALSGGVRRAFPLAGACGVPGSARALSLNVTVVPSADGDLRLYAGDQPVPLASTINFRGGRARANNAVLEVSRDANASIAVQPDIPGGTTTHLILDVNGFFQ